MSLPWSILGLSLLAGAIGLVWGLSEIIDSFKNETWRALQTGGAWLLMGVNFAAAALIFLLVASLVNGADNWLTALLVGFAWPTVVRNTSFKLAQPLPSEQTGEAAAVRFEQAYARVQTLALQIINNSLTRQRRKLMGTVIQHDLQRLARYARTVTIASPLPPEESEQFITNILRRNVEDEIKKALLAAFILRFGRDTLADFLLDQPAPTSAAPTGRKPDTKPVTAPVTASATESFPAPAPGPASAAPGHTPSASA
jgi:hypothetical protein